MTRLSNTRLAQPPKPSHPSRPLSDAALVQVVATCSSKSPPTSRSTLTQIVNAQAAKLSHYRSMIKVDRSDMHGHVAGLPIRTNPELLGQVRRRCREQSVAGSDADLHCGQASSSSPLPPLPRSPPPSMLSSSSTLWSRLGTYGFDDEEILSMDIFSVRSLWVVHDRWAPFARVYRCEDGQVYALHGGAAVRSPKMAREVLAGLAGSGRQFWITLGGIIGGEGGFEEVFKDT